MHIYTLPFKPIEPNLNAFSQLHTHMHTYICIWSKSPRPSSETTHSFWVKNELQSLLHRERKCFNRFNAKLIKPKFLKRKICSFNKTKPPFLLRKGLSCPTVKRSLPAPSALYAASFFIFLSAFCTLLS